MTSVSDASDVRVLLVEPFYGGSHKQLMDLLCSCSLPAGRSELYTLSAKKWHWRARTAALSLAQTIPRNKEYKVLFCSSVLNLAELVALRPDLASLKKVLYFHENQLVYPVRKQQDRDFQYGYNQILSSLVADTVVFNSEFNKESFLNNINSFLKLVPDYRPKGLVQQIRPKCKVVYFPVNFPTKQLPEEGRIHPQENVSESDGQESKSLTSHGTMPYGSQHIDAMTQSTTATEYRDETPRESGVRSREEKELVMVTTNSETKVHASSIPKHQNICSPSFPEDHDWGIGQLHGAERKRVIPACDSVNKKQHVTESACCRHEPCPSTMPGENDEKRETVLRQDRMGAGVSDNLQTKMDTPEMSDCLANPGETSKCDHNEGEKPLHIVWPHRWEHDKGPEVFFQTVCKLHEEGMSFKLSVLGETYTDIPAVFTEAKDQLKEHIVHWGYQTTKAGYFRILEEADVVVSTANHEFFGVAIIPVQMYAVAVPPSAHDILLPLLCRLLLLCLLGNLPDMLEAASLGCYPLCPRKLAYPEIFPDQCLYNTDNQLLKKLRYFCRKPSVVRTQQLTIAFDRFSWETLRPVYVSLLSDLNDQAA